MSKWNFFNALLKYLLLIAINGDPCKDALIQLTHPLPCDDEWTGQMMGRVKAEGKCSGTGGSGGRGQLADTCPTGCDPWRHPGTRRTGRGV